MKVYVFKVEIFDDFSAFEFEKYYKLKVEAKNLSQAWRLITGKFFIFLTLDLFHFLRFLGGNYVYFSSSFDCL